MSPRSNYNKLKALRDNFLEEATNYCLLGSTDIQLSEFFRVPLEDIKYWAKHIDEFAYALEKGRLAADARIASAMFRKAEGFVQQEERLMTVGLGKGVSHVKKVKTDVYYPPDTQAGKFWLTNRSRNWRDKQSHELTGADGGAISSELTINFVGMAPLPTPTPIDVTPGSPAIETEYEVVEPAND
jgi:hypothetical protein